MQLQLCPVYSELATKIPAKLARMQTYGYRLSAHQVRTYVALNNPQTQLVFNVSLTGDGKSLAGQLRQIINPLWYTLALYPTNELMRDQHRSVQQTWQRVDADQKHLRVDDIYQLDRRRLDALMLDWAEATPNTPAQRGPVLQSALNNAQMVLTNPDIFHLIMQFRYWRPGWAKDRLSSTLIHKFNQLTFDEFHLFEAPQIAAILTALILMREVSGYNFKTLFLSATPGKDVLNKLELAGFPQNSIKLVKGSYCYDDAARDAPDRWRQILHAARLTLAPDSIHAWLEAHLEDTLIAFFKDQAGHARGAIILDSVARAQGVYRLLKERLAPLGIDVRLNTGLTRSTDWHQGDLIVATSTVDVGVDFAINFLLFEASDASRFLQRLGRLGRHSEFTDRSDVQRSFADYMAVALLPGFVYSRLATTNPDEPALLSAANPIDRDQLRKAVENAFVQHNTFAHYLSDWGKFMPAHVLSSLNNKEIRTTYRETVTTIKVHYENVFKSSMYAAKNEYITAFKTNPDMLPLVLEACSFRGESPFTCAVLINSKLEQDHPAATYDLFWLLANTHLSLCSRDEFLGVLKARFKTEARFQDQFSDIRVYQQPGLFAFGFLEQFRSDYREVMINLDRSSYDFQRMSEAQKLTGIQLECPDFEDQNALNEKLESKIVVATVFEMEPRLLRQRLGLPGLFRLYPCRFKLRSGLIAFAREALLLDSVLRWSKLSTSSMNPRII